MAEWPIVITGPAGSATFDPNPLQAASGDTVFWSNRSDANHTIVVDAQNPQVPMPAPPWESSKPAYKVPNLPSPPPVPPEIRITYRCIEPGHGNEVGRIVVTALLLMAVLGGFFAPSLTAQVTCSQLIGGELKSPAEVGVRDEAKQTVRGTLVTTGEKQLIAFPNATRVTGPITVANITCKEQWNRTYRKDEPAPNSQQPNAPAVLPEPGPTIRAKVGDLVELTFLNQIDPLNFPGTDTGDCDQVQGQTGPVYPRTDSMPNCFHGSVFTNVHYHGTHTSPNSTADNVFLEIVPTPRSNSAARTPTITAASVKDQFAQFFGDCERNVNNPNSAQIWPHIWDQLPKGFRETQDIELGKAQPKLLKANGNAIQNGAFPQNYIGAFPYCFRLPVWTANPAPVATAASHGEGSTEHDDALTGRPVIMGQAPGTHWYHAHKHGSTTLNVANGMTGVMVIEGDYDKQINAFYNTYGGIKQQVIVLNQIGGIPRREGGNVSSPGPYFSVNGRLQPNVTMKPGAVQFWRIANTSSRTTLILKVPPDLTWRQLAQDGVQLTDRNYKASENADIVLASGNRADLLVKTAPHAQGVTYPINAMLTMDPSIPTTTTQTLLNIKTIKSEPGDKDVPFMDPAPTQPPFLGDIKDADITGRKTIVFATNRDSETPNFTKQTIDGKQFNGEVGALVLMNQVEEWKIVNESYAGTNIAHPFHIHINPFQITEVFTPNETMRTAKGTGSVSILKNTATVTGYGTTFTTEIRPGWVLNIPGAGRTIVLSVQDNTTLTLTGAIGSTDVPRTEFTMDIPRYVFLSTPRPLDGQCYLDPNNPASWKPCAAAPQPPPDQRIWWDVFPIPTGLNVTWAGNTSGTKVPGYFKLRSRFVDYSGYYVIHCHILSHEDRGMMTVVYVAPLQPPFSHH
jgi:FtsP/CotA-like multicopper oxidase with cupredoxin domain